MEVHRYESGPAIAVAKRRFYFSAQWLRVNRVVLVSLGLGDDGSDGYRRFRTRIMHLGPWSR